MNKAISPGSEFTEIGNELPVELQYFDFGESAAGPQPVPPAPTTQTGPDPTSGSTANGSADAKPKPAYPAPAGSPTRPKGLRFDFQRWRARFSSGRRAASRRVRLRDLDTGNILFETEFAGGRVNNSKRYCVRFGIEVTQLGKTVLGHEYSARDQDILIQFPVGTLRADRADIEASNQLGAPRWQS